MSHRRFLAAAPAAATFRSFFASHPASGIETPAPLPLPHTNLHCLEATLWVSLHSFIATPSRASFPPPACSCPLCCPALFSCLLTMLAPGRAASRAACLPSALPRALLTFDRVLTVPPPYIPCTPRLPPTMPPHRICRPATRCKLAAQESRCSAGSTARHALLSVGLPARCWQACLVPAAEATSTSAACSLSSAPESPGPCLASQHAGFHPMCSLQVTVRLSFQLAAQNCRSVVLCCPKFSLGIFNI